MTLRLQKEHTETIGSGKKYTNFILIQTDVSVY